MTVNKKNETAIFIYAYLTNIFGLPYSNSLNGYILWGFNSVNDQRCVINAGIFENINEFEKDLWNAVTNRRTNLLRLAVCGRHESEPCVKDEAFTQIAARRVYLYRRGKTARQEILLQPVTHLFGTSVDPTVAVSGEPGDRLISLFSVDNLAALQEQSLLYPFFISDKEKQTPSGLIFAVVLANFVVIDVSCSGKKVIDKAWVHDLVGVVGQITGFARENRIYIVASAADDTCNLNFTIAGSILNYIKTTNNSDNIAAPHLPKSLVLRDRSQVEDALASVTKIGLPTHNDDAKNWDSLAAFSAVVNNEAIAADSAILDAGGEYYSVLLYQLAACGYKNLHCINLSFTASKRIDNIEYSYGDITRTSFADDFFSAVTCLSVIEHGVDLNSFFFEMRRILKNAGILFISTDYWERPIDTGGKTAYGCPVKIFDKKDIELLITTAKQHGFYLREVPRMDCKSKIVHWEGFSYTFIYLTFIKLSDAQI
jgi:SAM-dependent methyltransferase